MFNEIKPSGYNPNLHKLDLFFPYNLKATYKDRVWEFSIEVRNMKGKPDCKIGCWEENCWFRTKSALKENWAGYSSYGKLAQAVETTLKNKGFSNFIWEKRND